MGDTETVDSIKQFGLLMELSRGSAVGEPDAIWASPDMPSPDRTFVEFTVPPDDQRVAAGGLVGSHGPSDVAFSSDIKPEEIIAVHEPWHEKHRYLSEEPYRQSTLDGEYDGLSETSDYGPAIEAIKRSQPDPVLRVPAPPREEEPPAPEPINANGLPYVPGADPVTREARLRWRSGNSWDIRDAIPITDSAVYFQKQADLQRGERISDLASGVASLLGDDDIDNLGDLVDRWNDTATEGDPEYPELDEVLLPDREFDFREPGSSLTNREVINGLMEQRGVSTIEDLIKSIAAEAEEIALESFNEGVDADTIITVPKAGLKALLEDGRFKTQFESGTSMGILDPNVRAEVESFLMGIPIDLDPTLRPVYGHADTRSEGERISDLVGSRYLGYDEQGLEADGFHLVLRRELDDKTTTVYGDTMGDKTVPVHRRDIDGSEHSNNRIVAAMRRTFAAWHQREIVQSLFRNDPHDYPDELIVDGDENDDEDDGKGLWPTLKGWTAGYGSADPSPSKTTYFEKQVHGGVSLEDVATLVVSWHLPIEEALTPDELKILEDAGVEVVHENDYIKKAPNAEEAVSAILNAPWAAEDPSTRFARIQMGVSDLPAEALENFIETDATTGLQVVNEVAIEKKRRELLGQVREFASRKRSEGDLTGEDREVAIQAAEDLKAIAPLREAIKRHISAQDDRPSEQRIDEERDKVGGLGNLPPATEWPPVLPYDPTDLGYLGGMRNRRALARRIIYKEINDLLDDWTTAGGNPEELGFADNGAMVESLAEDAVDVLEQMARAQNDEKSADSTRIALTAENVLEVLTGGRYLTQFESDSSRGRLDKLLRMKVEEEQFGVTGEVVSGFIDDLEPRLRPVYGVIPDDNSMGIEDEQPFMEGQYGDSWLVLKKSTRERSTYTFGDSLSKGTFGQPLNGGGDSLVTADDYYLRLVAQIAFESATDEAIVDREDEYAHLNFLEVQIHGGVSLYDIEEIYVPFEELSANEVATMQRTASILGIKVTDSSPQPFLYLPKADTPDIKEEPPIPAARSAFALVQLSNRIADNNGVRIRRDVRDLLEDIEVLRQEEDISWTDELDLLRAQESMYTRLIQEHAEALKNGFPDLLDSELEEAVIKNAIDTTVLSQIKIDIDEHKSQAPAVELPRVGFTPFVMQKEVSPPRSGVPEKPVDMIIRLRELRHGGSRRGQGTKYEPEFTDTPEQEAIGEALAASLFENGIGDAEEGWTSSITSWELIDIDGRLDLHVQGDIIDDITEDYIGTFDRTVNLLDNSVEHFEFSMSDGRNNRGIGKAFISQTFVNFVEAGITSVNLVGLSDPRLDMNGFSVWPRLGAEIVPGTISGKDTQVLEALLQKELSQITAQDIKEYTDKARASGNYDEIMNDMQLSADMTFDLTNGLPPELGATPPDVVEEASDYILRIVPPLREEMRQLKSDEDSLKEKFTTMLDVAHEDALFKGSVDYIRTWRDGIFFDAGGLLLGLEEHSADSITTRISDAIDAIGSDIASFEADMENLFPDNPTDAEIMKSMMDYASNKLIQDDLFALESNVSDYIQAATAPFEKKTTVDTWPGEKLINSRKNARTRFERNELSDRNEIFTRFLITHPDLLVALGAIDVTTPELLERVERELVFAADGSEDRALFEELLSIHAERVYWGERVIEKTMEALQMETDFVVNQLRNYVHSLGVLEALRDNAVRTIREMTAAGYDDQPMSEVLTATRNGYLELMSSAGGIEVEEMTSLLKAKFAFDKAFVEVRVIDEEIAMLEGSGAAEETYSEEFQKVRNSIRHVGDLVLSRDNPGEPILGLGFAGDIGPDGLARVKAVNLGDNGIYDTGDAIAHLLRGGAIAEIPDTLVLDSLVFGGSKKIVPELEGLYSVKKDLPGIIGDNYLIQSNVHNGKGVFIKGYGIFAQANELLGQELAHLMGFPTLPGRWGSISRDHPTKRNIIMEHALNHVASVKEDMLPEELFNAMDGDPDKDFGLHQRILNHLLNLYLGVTDRHSQNVVLGRDLNGNYVVMPIDLAMSGETAGILEYSFDMDSTLRFSGGVHNLIQRQLDEKRTVALKSALRETVAQAIDRVQYMVAQRDRYIDDILNRLAEAGGTPNDLDKARRELSDTIDAMVTNLEMNPLERIYQHYGIDEGYEPRSSGWRVVEVPYDRVDPEGSIG
jgi:hypothetical protein